MLATNYPFDLDEAMQANLDMTFKFCFTKKVILITTMTRNKYVDDAETTESANTNRNENQDNILLVIY